MICTKCGKEVKEGVTFCGNCGEKINIAENVATDVENSTNGLKKKGKKGLFITLISLICVVVIVLGIVLFVHRKEAQYVIDLSEYASIEFEGYNGLGNANWKFDEDDFLDDYEDVFSFPSSFEKKVKELESKNLKGLIEYYCEELDIDIEDPDDEEMAELVYFLLFDGTSLSNAFNLNNGDKVEISWGWDEMSDQDERNQICELFGITINEDKLNYIAHGLIEVPQFDPFEGVEISYYGAAPAARALLANYPDNGWTYMLSGPDTVKNGDEIKIGIYSTQFSVEEYIEAYGKAPSSMEKTYTVSGLPTYITSASQIPEEILKEMQAQAEDIIKGTTYGWSSGYSLDISYIGNYMLAAKNIEELPQNMFILIYKLHYTNSFMDYTGTEKEYSTEYYYYVNWNDLKINDDGTCVYDKNTYWKTEDTFWVATNIFSDCDLWGNPTSYSEYDLKFTGYQTLDEVYNAYITRNIENYKFEENYVE